MSDLLRPTIAASPYGREIAAVLPRILASIDRDPLSPTFGIADRQFWAWKLIDFPNGTMQGFANGLASLLAADAYSDHVDRKKLCQTLVSLGAATRRMMRADGSFEEALPYEQSFCVTALVAYDQLKAVEHARGDVRNETAYLARSIEFLIKTDERHGFISNHLATAVIALLKWHQVHGDQAALRRAEQLLSQILEHQSDEGWFEEYGGADPGYQTLCMTHLAEAAEVIDTPDLWNALEKGARFLRHFVQPDGSFGGVYGSRATRIYYPAAMERLGLRFEVAQAIAHAMRKSIAMQSTIPLSAIDAPNLSPVFNNYCDALAYAEYPKIDSETKTAPIGFFVFPEARLVVDTGQDHHTIVSLGKTVVQHWRKDRLCVDDCGLVLRDSSGRIVTSQSGRAVAVETDSQQIMIEGPLVPRTVPIPNAYNFLFLRILSVTIMRFPAINRWIKSQIARFMLNASRETHGSMRRTIRLGPDLKITDTWYEEGLTRIQVDGEFSAIHMASVGYWQTSDSAGKTS